MRQRPARSTRTDPLFPHKTPFRFVPVVGGDTLFADMAAAFRGLSPAMQDWCRSLSAVHDIARVFAKRLGKSAHELHEQYPPQLHPVVRTHPETGEQALYVNTAFTSHIEALSATESEGLPAHPYPQAAVPEIQCRLDRKSTRLNSSH